MKQDCTYCKREMVPDSDTHPTRDHAVPKSRGGRRTVPCCATCNEIKADMMPDVWWQYMQDSPRWWVGRECLAHVRPCPVMVMVAEFFIRQRYGVWVSTAVDVARLRGAKIHPRVAAIKAGVR